MERRAAVIDLGSNSFRLVVFTWTDDWWKRTDEIHEGVRIGEHQGEDGTLQAEPVRRALSTLDVFAHFCRATGIDDVRPVATSAIREASNRGQFLERARAATGLDVRVLSREDEARYGYLAAVNSTTLADGAALDVGGGSLQLVRVAGRRAVEARSWRLGAVRMTEAFMAGERQSGGDVERLRAHAHRELGQAPWICDVGRVVALGGTVRNLATAAQRLEGRPAATVQGARLTRAALAELVDRLLDLPAAERSKLPGIKPARADIILAGAVVVDAVLEAAGLEELEVTRAGLREGVFFEALLPGQDPPLLDDVRRGSVLNLAAQYGADLRHAEHVGRLAAGMWEVLSAAGRFRPADREPELLWAAAMLHDVGMAVDYDDHHKHGRYLVLNAGLPGFSLRETAIVAQAVRYHRKGSPSLDELAHHGADGDEQALLRLAALLRIAEQLERARDQVVRHADLALDGDGAVLRLVADEDVTLALWSAAREARLFERAFDLPLTLVTEP